MRNFDFNMYQLEEIAGAIDPYLDSVVFVGGSTTALLVDNGAHPFVRQTKDVDIIVKVTTNIDYDKFKNKLMKNGFYIDITCEHTASLLHKGKYGAIQLDVLPMHNPNILGFTNNWYQKASENPQEYTLPSKIKIKHVSIAYYLATKFEAFFSRGRDKNDSLNFYCNDIEDIVFVLGNKETILFDLIEIKPTELQNYLCKQFQLLLDNDEFINVLDGLTRDPELSRIVITNLKAFVDFHNS